MRVGSSVHQPGTVNENVLESDFGLSVMATSVSELDASCNLEPVQGDKERCDMGSLGSQKTSRAAAFWIICKSLIVHDGSPARRELQ